MKFVVLACALSAAFCQTATGSDPIYTHVNNTAPGAAGSDAAAASSGESTRGSASTNTPVQEQVNGNETPNGATVPLDYVDNQEQNQEETGATFGNRKSSIHWDTHNVDEHGNVTHDGSGTTYDNNGRVTPTTATTYDAAAAKACCDGSTECAGDDACKFGCKSWLAYSSLNWEAAWRSRLLKRCRKACLQPRKWHVLHEDKARLNTALPAGLSQSYWYGRTAPADILTAPFDKYNKLPFHTAHECNSDSDCSAGTCSSDHAILRTDFTAKTANSVDPTTSGIAECINTAEARCNAGCLAFATCQWNQDNAGLDAPA